MDGKPLDIVRSNPRVEDARTLPARKILRQDWVREACRACRFYGRSWSCPPGVRAAQTGKTLSGYRHAIFLKFKSSGNRKALEQAVLDMEAGLRRAGFPRAMGFFASPCSACKACSYPEPCLKPELCRPTGESWGIDLLETSRRAGLQVELVKAGEEFTPVTLFLLE